MSDDELREAVRDLRWILSVIVQRMCSELHPIDLEKMRAILDRIEKDLEP